jgi:hypothetical protein
MSDSQIMTDSQTPDMSSSQDPSPGDYLELAPEPLKDLNDFNGSYMDQAGHFTTHQKDINDNMWPETRAAIEAYENPDDTDAGMAYTMVNLK